MMLGQQSKLSLVRTRSNKSSSAENATCMPSYTLPGDSSLRQSSQHGSGIVQKVVSVLTTILAAVLLVVGSFAYRNHIKSELQIQDLVARNRQLETRVEDLVKGERPHMSELMKSHYTSLSEAKLTALATQLKEDYAANKPFPHIAIDGLFPQELLNEVLLEFPERRVKDECPVGWHCYKAEDEHKIQLDSEEHMGSATRFLFSIIKSSTFIKFLEQLTGIEGLIADPHYRGSGLHQIAPGGHLNLHADFNKYPKLELDRRVNTFIYLNDDWEESWGGHLELWSRDLKDCTAKIAPSLGRFVVFSSTDYSYHGHPNPLMAPEGRSRRSIALYYYTNGRPREEIIDPEYKHSTLFVKGKCQWCEQCRPQDAREFLMGSKVRTSSARSY